MMDSRSADTNSTSGWTMRARARSRTTSTGATATRPSFRGSTWSAQILASCNTSDWCEKNGAGGSRKTPIASSRIRLVSSVSYRYSSAVMGGVLTDDDDAIVGGGGQGKHGD